MDYIGHMPVKHVHCAEWVGPTVTTTQLLLCVYESAHITEKKCHQYTTVPLKFLDCQQNTTMLTMVAQAISLPSISGIVATYGLALGPQVCSNCIQPAYLHADSESDFD